MDFYGPNGIEVLLYFVVLPIKLSQSLVKTEFHTCDSVDDWVRPSLLDPSTLRNSVICMFEFPRLWVVNGGAVESRRGHFPDVCVLAVGYHLCIYMTVRRPFPTKPL